MSFEAAGHFGLYTSNVHKADSVGKHGRYINLRPRTAKRRQLILLF